MSLPRALTPPTVRSTWRLPADRALLEARGLNYWDNVNDRPRESPQKGEGRLSNTSFGGSPRAGAMPAVAVAHTSSYQPPPPLPAVRVSVPASVQSPAVAAPLIPKSSNSAKARSSSGALAPNQPPLGAEPHQPAEALPTPAAVTVT
jgi:hypothetical protein